MSISAIDMFSIGIGPSSSHTVGPMRAAMAYMDAVPYDPTTETIAVTLHGSLAATGVGHGTDRAVILGLAGFTPLTTTATTQPAFGLPVPLSGISHGPRGAINYCLTLDPIPLPAHPNALTFSTINNLSGQESQPQIYYSTGGGFILSEEEYRSSIAATDNPVTPLTQEDYNSATPYPFHNARELMDICTTHSLSIPEIMLANEEALHGSTLPVLEHLDNVWTTMQSCIAAGVNTRGTLPGGLNVTRRAPEMYERAQQQQKDATNGTDGLWAMEWVNLYALAVNEENAAGGRVVTAPTNGAAGIIPAVLLYAKNFLPSFTDTSHRDFLLVAAAIGMIIKENASISGAEVGCQGEVGSASAMAAAGLYQLMGGVPEQVEHSAEVALEHNLGLTCDPVGGLVQIPCIERNAIGAVKSINAARLTYYSSGNYQVTLDDVIKTMADTGRDMLTKYKETATGGLAVNLGFPVNLTEC